MCCTDAQLRLTPAEIESARAAYRESLGGGEVYTQPKTMAEAKRRVAASAEFDRLCGLSYQRSYEAAVNLVTGLPIYGR